MSVRVKLTDKNFFQSPFVIGSRLNEAEGDTNQANGVNQTNATNQTNGANQANSGNTGPSAVDVFNWTIMKNFANMANQTFADFKNIKELQQVQWVEPKTPAKENQNVEGYVKGVQEFLTANIEAVKKFVESSAQKPAQ